MILCLQVLVGFPPFYRKFALFVTQEDFEKIERYKWQAADLFAKFFIGAMTAIILMNLTGVKYFLVVFGIVSVWAGLRLRRHLFQMTGGPLPTFANKWTRKWPMLVFDIWTMTVSLGCFLLMTIS